MHTTLGPAIAAGFVALLAVASTAAGAAAPVVAATAKVDIPTFLEVPRQLQV